MKKKVAILGTGTGWENAPFKDKTVEIWAVATLITKKRIDRSFELHANVTPQVHEVLQKAKYPVYMQSHYPQYPSSVAYPIDEMILMFGKHFDVTISYMFALAIYENYEEIRLCGVMMEHETEYDLQKASVDYFVGWARGKGIKVIIPPESDVGKSYRLYGYQTPLIIDKMSARRMAIAKELENIKQEQRRINDQVARHVGGIEMADYFLNYLNRSKQL